MSKKKIIGFFVGVMLFSVSVIAFVAYGKLFKNNVKPKVNFALKIPMGSSYDDLLTLLKNNNLLNDYASFSLIAKQMKFNKVYGGNYLIKPGMSNIDLVRKFRGGLQDPVKLTFNNLRTLNDLAAVVSTQLEMDSLAFLTACYDSAFLKENAFDSLTVACLFIPNTYEVYWNVSPVSLLGKMKNNYNQFWETNASKLNQLKLTPIQVSILASIVEAEQLVHADERPTIAGLYLNRLQKNMMLESDPTVIFALGNFDIKRVLNYMKEIDSAYNTYRHSGLPPGPIRLADKNSLEAVLNYRKTDYIFMCAKEDFSNYHNFAVDLSTHNQNARNYQAALNKLNIYK